MKDNLERRRPYHHIRQAREIRPTGHKKGCFGDTKPESDEDNPQPGK